MLRRLQLVYLYVWMFQLRLVNLVCSLFDRQHRPYLRGVYRRIANSMFLYYWQLQQKVPANHPLRFMIKRGESNGTK